MNAETPLSPAFVRWFRQHGPKGVNNSIHALCLLLLLRDAKKPLRRFELSKHMRQPEPSIRTLLRPMIAAGMIAEELQPYACRYHKTIKAYRLAKPLEAPALS